MYIYPRHMKIVFLVHLFPHSRSSPGISAMAINISAKNKAMLKISADAWIALTHTLPTSMSIFWHAVIETAQRISNHPKSSTHYFLIPHAGLPGSKNAFCTKELKTWFIRKSYMEYPNETGTTPSLPIL